MKAKMPGVGGGAEAADASPSAPSASVDISAPSLPDREAGDVSADMAAKVDALEAKAPEMPALGGGDVDLAVDPPSATISGVNVPDGVLSGEPSLGALGVPGDVTIEAPCASGEMPSASAEMPSAPAEMPSVSGDLTGAEGEVAKEPEIGATDGELLDFDVGGASVDAGVEGAGKKKRMIFSLGKLSKILSSKKMVSLIVSKCIRPRVWEVERVMLCVCFVCGEEDARNETSRMLKVHRT